MNGIGQYVERDLKYIWHPCSQMKDYEELPPIVIERGEGAYLYDITGGAYIDIISSWWCNLLGHNNPTISSAIKKQLDTLEHVIFANFSHKGIIDYAERLSKLLPKGLTKFHFNDNGSASIEAALKMALQYQLQTGHSQKTRFICLTDSYHGETAGALSVGALDLYTKIYKPLLVDTLRVESPDCYRCPYGRNRSDCVVECAKSAEDLFERFGKESAALIAEPLLQAAGGMKIYPAAYLKRIRELCDYYGVLLIADEIATGFGRTGKMFASEHANISPDIICLSKGITGGYLPFSVAVTTDNIYNAFYADYCTGKAFLHSHTYSGNPLGAAAANAVLDIFEKESVLEQAADTAEFLSESLAEALAGHKNVGEIRGIGLINAVELVKNKSAKEPFEKEKRLGYEIYKKALNKGLLLRPLGDVLYFNPPLNIDKGTLSKAVEITRQSIEETL